MILGRRVVHYPVVASTMDEIDALAETGAAEGVVITTDHQTAGRGRAGRAWDAPPGAGFLCSILLRPSVPPDRLTTLPLIIGVAVADAIEALIPVRFQLKWPNDVWIAGRKVAGILVTSRAIGSAIVHVNLGIGINVNIAPPDLPAGATSFLAETGVATDRAALFRSVLEHCDAVYQAYLITNGKPDLEPWRARAAMLGDEVVIRLGEEAIAGSLKGIADDGALLLDQGGPTVRRILAGDLTRGPVAAVCSAHKPS